MDEGLVAIVPCTDLDAAERFFGRLGFVRDPGCPDAYRMLTDDHGARVHLSPAAAGWLVPGRNPFGLYLYRRDVDALAALCRDEIIEQEGVGDKPWGMREFALNGPDDILVRVGWPSRPR